MWHSDYHGTSCTSQEETLLCVHRDKHVRSCFNGGAVARWSLYGLGEIDLEILLLGEPAYGSLADEQTQEC